MMMIVSPFKRTLSSSCDEPRSSDDHSTHEKRLAQLSEQISQLESENVGKKDWTLLGEAGARGRPMNSLLEEDLEYERVAKIAPIVTEESTKVLEDRIKARILEVGKGSSLPFSLN
jgi:U3 small nucleolar RNA-associated protein MPP10